MPIIDNRELERLQRQKGIGPTQQSKAGEINALPRPKGFRGRKDELRTLASYLRSTTISVVIVEGISGIGKTALAARFAASLGRYGYSAAWIDCREETTIDSITSQMAEICRKIGRDEVADALDDSRGSLGARLQRITGKLQGMRLAVFLNEYHLMSDPRADELIRSIEERTDLIKIFMTTSRHLDLSLHLQAAGFAEERLQDGLDKTACQAFLRDCKLDVSSAEAEHIWNSLEGVTPRLCRFSSLGQEQPQ